MGGRKEGSCPGPWESNRIGPIVLLTQFSLLLCVPVLLSKEGPKAWTANSSFQGTSLQVKSSGPPGLAGPSS